MSAHIVGKPHIDAIVRAALRFEMIGISDTDRVGQLLWDANHDNVNHRYPTHPKAVASRYHYTVPAHDLTPIEIVKAVECLDYQSSDIDSWKTSEACHLLTRLMKRAIAKIPGYENAKWSIA